MTEFKLTEQELEAASLYKGKQSWGFGPNKVNIVDMTDNHIKNAIALLEKKVTAIKGRNADKAKKDKSAEGIKEANRIWGLPTRELLCEFTEYGVLIQELESRSE